MNERRWILGFRDEAGIETFYDLYEPKGGPVILVSEEKRAHRFPDSSWILNVVAGDDRLPRMASSDTKPGAFIREVHD